MATNRSDTLDPALLRPGYTKITIYNNLKKLVDWIGKLSFLCRTEDKKD